MSQSLTELETTRTKLLQQFLSLGDFRPGTVSTLARRCGKPKCHCAHPDGEGHPQFRLLRKVKGKSVSESFHTPAAFRKAAQEVGEYHRFQDLAAQLTTANEQICRLRPAESGETRLDCGGKKTAAAVHQEVTREVQTLLQVVFASRRKDPRLDLEAVEMATRAGLHRAGAAVLTGLLAEEGGHAGQVTCGCRQQAHYHDHRPKQLLTVLGSLQFKRAY
jgi:hypothetical protein